MRLPGARSALLALCLPALVGLGACGRSSEPDPKAAPPASAALRSRAARLPASWSTYHGDEARTGVAVGAPTLHQAGRAWTSSRLDGEVYASPVAARGLIFAATENNTVYGLARDGRTLWRTHLGRPVDGATLPCGNIDPSGITGTPVVDARRGVLYVVAFLAGPARHELVALDARTGRVRFRRPADAPGADPKVHQERSALSLSGGRVIVPYGGLFGDCGNYHGQVVSLPAGGRGPARSYRVPTQREGGIWAPSGAAVSPDGDLLVVTGNGSSTSRFDYGNSVIRLGADLRPKGYFAPHETLELNSSDVDLGSVGPMLLPGGRVFVIGKSGVAYLLDPDRLGGVGGQRAQRKVCDGAFGGSAASGGLAYAPCGEGVVAVRAQGDRLAVAWRGPGFRAGPPVVAGGAVWSLDLDSGTLWALDARTGRARFSFPTGDVAQFSTPAVAGGQVIVVGDRRVQAVAFGG